MKIFRTVLMSMVLMFAGILWATRAEFLPSMSAFAFKPNNIFYIGMHFCIFFTFLIDGIVSKGIRWTSYFVSLGALGILAFDMYSYPMAHNLITAFTVSLAVFNMIFHGLPKNRPLHILNGVVAGLFFFLGVLTSVHLFLAEAIAEFTIAVSMLWRIWKEEK